MKQVGTGCLTIILVLLLAPITGFAGGWFVGLILQYVFGNEVTAGLNLLFNTTRFTPDVLPIICGTLGVVGSFFRNTTISTK